MSAALVYDLWVIITGALAAAACGLLGCFLVLRRMSMMGDAISHAVLPGLALAFMLTGTRTSASMFVGAAVVGVLTAVFTQWVHTRGKVEQGAAMGVVFTSLFAVGLLLLSAAAHYVDLDPRCVLYGALELTPLDSFALGGGWEIPRATLTLGMVLLADLALVLVLYKELKLSSFDPQLATTLGINATVVHYLLMTFVAITVVAAFESVGSIIVIAMLIVPAAAASLLTTRLSTMLLLSAAIGVASAALGHIGAMQIPRMFGFQDTTTAGMIAVAAGALFGVAWLFAPRQGVLSALVRRLRLSVRIIREDILGLLYRLRERGEPAGASDVLALMRTAKSHGLLASRLALWMLRRQGMLATGAEQLALTPSGLERGRQLIRAHRLWEAYLEKHGALSQQRLHLAAERLEHETDAALRRRLDAEMGEPARDPHGREIPPSVRRDGGGSGGRNASCKDGN